MGVEFDMKTFLQGRYRTINVGVWIGSSCEKTKMKIFIENPKARVGSDEAKCKSISHTHSP